MNFKVGLVSLGCEKNRVDAEMLMYSLREHGYQLVEDVADADVAIVNTCGFIESAKQESIDEIIELGKLKAEGKIKKIIVTGCLAQRYKQDIMKNLFEVDAVAGIGANQNIAEIVEQTLKDEKPEVFPDKLLLPLDGKRIQSTPFYYSYIKIAEGCSNCCSYCAIPLIRGKFRSRKMENIIQEAEGLVENGVKELIVIAQDTTKYGTDIYGVPSLAMLLKELCKIDGLKWIRVLYCYPENLTDELIDAIANEEKIVKYIDLPMQHCSKAVLENMNRNGNMETLREKVNKLRSKIPDITIRTTFITGFPGETEEDFNELALFAKEMKFQRLGCFAYSQEENTKAALMSEQIDDEIKQKRADIIMEQQQLIMEEYCKSLKGKTIEVLFEGYDRYAECYFGRSQADAPEVDGLVFFTIKGKKPQVGDFVKVKINDYLGCDPVGEMTF